jgi:hypothetical protein
MSLTASVSGSIPPLDRFNWNRAAVKWADTIGPIARTALKARAPVGKGERAGRFAASIRYDRRSTGGISVAARFTANTPYAKYVIEPTKPHRITAKAARYLHWTDDRGEHFAKSVMHPGTKGNDFAEQLMRHFKPIAQAAYERIMLEALGGTR